MDQTIHRKAFYNSILRIVFYAHLCILLWNGIGGCEAFLHIQPDVRTLVPIGVFAGGRVSTFLLMSSTQRKNGKALPSSQPPALQIKTFQKISSTGEVSTSAPSAPRNIVRNTNSEQSSPLPIEYDDSLSKKTDILNPLKCPKHIAFICDGNSRWAKQLNQSSSNKKYNSKDPQSNSQKPFQNEKDQFDKIRGHRKGAQQVITLLEYIKHNHSSVKYVTIYGFSSENWTRTQQEIRGIFKVIEGTATTVRDWAMKENLRIKLLGDIDDERIPSNAKRVLTQLEADVNAEQDSRSKDDDEEPLTLCIAVNYGGRNDIMSATRKIAQLVQNGEIDIGDIQEDTVDKLLGTVGVPDPDLVIRTGGEQRLSNFLIWNCAYSELYFTDVLWPDFGGDELDEALEWYVGRDRRFGGRTQED